MSMLMLLSTLLISTYYISNFSKAEVIEEVKINIQNADASKAGSTSINLVATEGNTNGIYNLQLPEYVEGKKVVQYIYNPSFEIQEEQEEQKTDIVKAPLMKSSINLASTPTLTAEGNNGSVGNNNLTLDKANDISENTNEIESKNINDSSKSIDITSKNINITTENTSDNNSKVEILEEKSEEEQTQEIEINANDVEIKTPFKLSIDKEKLEDKEISIKVQYDTKQVNNETLFNQNICNVAEIEGDEERQATFEITGYMPDGTTVETENATKNDETVAVSERYINDSTYVKASYEIKMMVNENEYEPKDYNEKVGVKIGGLGITEDEDYKVIHVKDNNELEEIEVSNIDIESNTIEFEAEGFSTYAIIANINGEGGTVMGWEGQVATKFSFGAGTQANPYLITTAEELAYLAQQVNRETGNTNYSGTYFQLAADIDLGGNTWSPIGNITRSFRGVFDGAGHTISNCIINTSSVTNAAVAYGFFGSIGGGNNSTAVVRNLEFSNIEVAIAVNGDVTNNSYGYKVGVVTGCMYNHSEISNVSVTNSRITHSGTFGCGYTITRNGNRYTVTYYHPIMFVGGIAGDQVNSSTSDTAPASNARAVIDNCFSDVDITVNTNAVITQGSNYANSTTTTPMLTYSQVNIGGIVGRIKSQNIWPTNSCYQGRIDTNGLTGPIFGAERNNTSATSTSVSDLNTIWMGDNRGSLTMTSRYISYNVGGTNFTSSITTGNVSNSTTYRRNANTTTNIRYVQGVNKSASQVNQATMLTNFNNTANGNSNYLNWKIANNLLTFVSRFEAGITAGANDTYTASYTNTYTNNMTYSWYVNEELRTDLTTQTITQARNMDTDYLLQVLVYDGQYYAVGTYVVKQIPLNLRIIKDGTSLKAEFYGEGVNYVDLTQYTYQWIAYPIITEEAQEITGATTGILTSYNTEYEYVLQATYPGNTNLFRDATYYEGNGTVIFVDYDDGNDEENDGFTPQTPVSTLEEAYSKLSSSQDARNIIVVMGDSTDDSGYLSDSTNTTTYNKKAILTGKYHGINYTGRLRMSDGRYLQNDTTFMYLEFRGSGGDGYLYCQGHSATMDEGITMTNYNNLSSTNGIIGDSAIGFCLCAGISLPTVNTIPANQNNSTITIKSGAYGRVILGSRNTSLPSTTLGNANNPFVCTLNIDIQNSTKGTWPYDINLLVGGRNKGSVYSEVTINGNSGSVGRIIGANLGYEQARNRPANSYYGTIDLNLHGISVVEVCGSGMGRSSGGDVYFYGTINIDIDGSEIAGSVYGGGLAGITGYHENSTDPYKTSYGQEYMNANGISKTTANITLKSGTVGGNIFGGGYGNSSILNSNRPQDMGAMYGDTYINIQGGTVQGSIYGAGEGVHEVTGYDSVAKMYGDTHIIKTGGTVVGEIYGGGKGLSAYPEIATVNGNTYVNIESDVSNSVYGGSAISKVTGNTDVKVKNCTYSASIYGGGNAGQIVGTTSVTLEGATSAGIANTGVTADIYGGGKSAEVTTSTVYIKTGADASNVFGGGEAASVPTTNVYLQGGNAQNIYGGSNQSGTVTTSNIGVTSGTATTIYGGNNIAGTTTTTNINLAGGTVTTIYGGGNLASTGTTNVNITSGTVTDTFGGGKSANVTVKANVTANGATINNNIYGGSDQSGTVKETLVIIRQGAPQNVYGGNNLGGTATTTTVNIQGGNSGNVYGGGYQAATTTSNVNLTNGTIANGFGGGESANVTTSNITLNGTQVTGNIYGGSNQEGTVTQSYVKVQNGTATSVFGGNNVGGTTITSNVQVTGGTTVNIYGGGYEAVTETTNVQLSGGTITNGFGGGASADVTTKANITVVNGITINGNIYGGSDQEGTVTETLVNINGGSPTNVYGGNNLGGTSILTNVNVTAGNPTNVYGGGYSASTETTNVNLTGGTITNGFGGGESADVTEKTNITLNGTNVTGNIYGGSNQAGTVAETDVKIMQGTPAEVYGGNNLGGTATLTQVSIQGGTIPKVYGGGFQASTGTTNVNLIGGTVTNAFGGGASADVTTKANVTLNGSTINNNIYGGSDQSGTVTETLVKIQQGTVSNVYGGNNIGGTATLTHVEINNGTIQNVYGGGFQANSGTTNVDLLGGTINNGFGGGESANVTTKANITLNGTTVNNNIYGGSNQAGTVADTLVTITRGTPKNVYGGNNLGGTATVTHVEINGGSIPNVYGGGYSADSGTTNVNLTAGTITNGFGGGESADVTVETNITLNIGTTVNGKIYGGSNQAGEVEETNVIIVKGYPEAVFGGNNLGGVAGTTNVTIQSGEIEEVYGGGFQAVTIATNVELTGGLVTNVFGGGQAANAGTTSVLVNGGKATTVYGGSNQEGTVTSSYVNLTSGEVITVYGGNNAGGNTVDTEVIINSDVRTVYGGGNQAQTTGNTNVHIISGTVGNNLYGGGNEAVTDGNTTVKISNASVGGSAFAGGNGQSAVVLGDSIIILEGNASVAKDVFGGGNAAATGTNTNNSTTAVCITGGTVVGDVYGAANTSTVYGSTYTKIGKDAVVAYDETLSTLEKGNILIAGTVFGGGKSNSAGAEEYDYAFESVIGNTYIDIDANGYSGTTDLEIMKSIFGSGNAATMTGNGYVNILNYGTSAQMKDNISIQRATNVTISNSHIYLEGTTDRTNAISTMNYAFNRINELTIKDDTVLYLASGANIVAKYTSLASNGSKATMTNSGNRLYMMEGQNFILETEAGNHGEVNGMTFFGVFTGKVGRNTGIYGTDYEDGDTIPEEADIFKRNSYVQGKNYTTYNADSTINVPHDITVDGFYTNFDEEGVIETRVIEPTPERAVYYQWIAGKISDDIFYDGIELIATKYATTATYVLNLTGLSYPNMIVDVVEFDTSDLISTVNFVDDSTIPNIELDADKANSTFGLTMTAGNSGWQTNGVTEFYTDEDDRDSGTYSGTTQFLSDNSDTTPTFSFYMGHSKNISTTEFMGTVTIKLKITYVEDNEILIKNAYVTLTLSSNSTFKLANDFYEGSITPGKEYSMFASTPTNITSKSSFSAYYSLYLGNYSDEVETGEYYDGFLLYDHWVISSCVLPAGTKITMIDSSVEPIKYYYYIVTNADETAQIKEFPFSRFIAMGSTNEHYIADDQSGYLTSTIDPTKKISQHYNETLDLVYEEYILQFDFENADIPTSLAGQTMKIELRDSQQEAGSDNRTKIAVNTDQYPMIFSVYSNKEATKAIQATPSTQYMYMGTTLDVGIETTYTFKTVNAETVYDTTYFDDALGLKITVYNGGTQLTSSDLTGIYIEKNGTKYYARADGSYRIKLADAISNVLTNITFHTENGDLESGAYTFNFDTFGSLDGIYYSSGIAHDDKNIQIINTVYGLKAEYDENCKIVDKAKGKTLNNNNNMNFNVKYSGNFSNPKIYIGLYRRRYDEVVSYDYELVDLADYVNETLVTTEINKVYKVTDTPQANSGENAFNLTLKEDLTTGTYKFTFMLYDGDNYIGNVEDMVIIK